MPDKQTNISWKSWKSLKKPTHKCTVHKPQAVWKWEFNSLCIKVTAHIYVFDENYVKYIYL